MQFTGPMMNSSIGGEASNGGPSQSGGLPGPGGPSIALPPGTMMPTLSGQPRTPLQTGAPAPTLPAGGGGLFDPFGMGAHGDGGFFGPQSSGLSTTTITPDSTLRDQRLDFNMVLPQMTAGAVDAPSPLDFGGFSIDPSAFSVGGGGGGGGGFTVTPQSVQQQAMDTFQSQLPQMNIDFADQTEDLVKRTAAMGRTGSGLFNRDTDYLSDRGRAAREALLGNLGFQAATTDASNDLQAQIATGNFDSQAKDRSLQGSMASASNALQAALANAQMNQSGQFFDREMNMRADEGNANRAQNADMFNIGNTMQLALERMGLAERQQGREDNLANQAQNDFATQMGFLGQGFANDPASMLMGGSGMLGNLAGMFGQNASQTTGGLGSFAEALMQMQGGGGGGGGGGWMNAIGNALGSFFGGGGQQASPNMSIAAPILSGAF